MVSDEHVQKQRKKNYTTSKLICVISINHKYHNQKVLDGQKEALKGANIKKSCINQLHLLGITTVVYIFS